jgi:transposase
VSKAYSEEMRERVIAEVESGASRGEAAKEFAVSASTALIWVKCFRQTGRCAKPRGGGISLRIPTKSPGHSEMMSPGVPT